MGTVLTHIRVGLAMFGHGPDAESIGLAPVLRLETSVSKLVKVPAGKGSGYGLTDAADHDRTLAVLAAGYADGYPRALGNGVGQVGVERPSPSHRGSGVHGHDDGGCHGA